MIKDTFNPVEITQEELEFHINRFIESQTGKSQQTLLTYRRSLKDFAKFFKTHSNICFLVEDIKKYLGYLKYRRKMSAHTIVTYLSALRQFCAYLTENGILEKNPVRRIKVTRTIDPDNFSYLTFSETILLLDSIDIASCSAMRDRAIIALMIGCAASEHDIVQANIQDIFKPRHKWYLHLHSQPAIDSKQPVPAEYLSYIIEYLHEKTGSPEEPLFTSNSNRSANKRMSVRGVKDCVFRRLQESGINREGLRLAPYTIRQTGAIMLAKTGIRPELLKSRLGLKRQTLVNRYFAVAADEEAGSNQRT